MWLKLDLNQLRRMIITTVLLSFFPDGGISDVVIGIDPLTTLFYINQTVYLDQDHLLVLVTGVHQKNLYTVDAVSVGLSVEDADDAS